MNDAYVLFTAVKRGILQGLEEGQLGADQSTTRAQAVTVIERIFSLNRGETLPVDPKAMQKVEAQYKTE